MCIFMSGAGYKRITNVPYPGTTGRINKIATVGLIGLYHQRFSVPMIGVA